MTDHESFVLLLAAKQISEPLSADEAAALEAHLATCPSCRSIAASMRRDDMMLRAQLGEVAVSPRVRRRVMDEAAGTRRFDWRLTLALAATLLLATIGVPLMAGALRPSPSPTPVVSDIAEAPPTVTVIPTPSSPAIPSPSPSVDLSPSPSDPPSTGLGPFVAAAYTLGAPVDRRDTISANFDADGKPTGEWTRTRTNASTGKVEVFSGPLTCLVIDGNEAWLAGPATTSDDPMIVAAFIHVRDGGPKGNGDRALLRLNNPGETLATFNGWCRTKFVPGGPYEVSTGEVQIEDAPR